jgi:DNA-binding NarL/FixJ family response regulator
MARRTIAASQLKMDINEIAQYTGINPPRVDPQDYVSYLVDGSPFEHLLWREIKITMKRAHLTVWQRAVFQLTLQGFSLRQIGVFYGRSHITIKQHLDAAYEKMEKISHRGVLTVMIEELGWPAVRESLAEKLEARIPNT